MLRRAKRLQETFNKFCTEYGHPSLRLDQEEWRQIEYLLWITQPFFKFTTALSKTKDVTIHTVFSIYNKLFDHLEVSIRQLQRKKIPWKQSMLAALYAAKAKLSQYYSMTDDIPGDIYAIGTMLAPQHKLQFFSSKYRGDNDNARRDKHRQSFQDHFKRYQQQISDNPTQPTAPSAAHQATELDMLLAPKESLGSQSNQNNEATEYLDSSEYYQIYCQSLLILVIGTLSVSPRLFWKENQHKFPALASLARDILSIPATGAGVERLFNSARDICHYRRGSLSPKTIQDLMMFMCSSKFEVEDEQLAFIKEYLSNEEAQEASEERDAQVAQDDDLDPISDNDEGMIELDENPLIEQSPSEFHGVLGKRRKSVASEPEDSSENDIPLPTTQRMSGRARKRSRLLDGYEIEI